MSTAMTLLYTLPLAAAPNFDLGPHDLGSGPTYAVAVGDVDQNSYDDVVTGNITTHPNVIFLGGISPCSDRLVTWAALDGSSAAFPDGNNTHDVQLADLNGDPYPDLIVGNNRSANYVYLNQGVAEARWNGFGAQPGHVFGDASSYTWALTTGDLNHDHRVDLIEGRNNGQSTLVWVGLGDGTFRATPFDLGDATDTHGVAVGDFDGNGLLDVATGNHGENKVHLQQERGVLTFGLAGVARTTGIVAADLDGNPWTDLAVANDGSPDLVLLSRGDGTFTSIPLNGESDRSTSIAAGDLNGDLATDLVITHMLAAGSTVWVNDGVGGFPPELASTHSTGDTYDAAIGDVNFDLKMDWVAGNRNGACGAPSTFWLNSTP